MTHFNFKTVCTFVCFAALTVSCGNRVAGGSTEQGAGDGDGDGDGQPTPEPPPPWGDGDGDGDGSGDGDGDGGGDGDGDGDGATFIPPSDGAIYETCDPFLQDCADGDKCVPYRSVGDTWDSNKCVPVLGLDEVGDECLYHGAVVGTDTCDATSLCWDADENGVGTCHAFCTGNAQNPICDNGTSCLIGSSGAINLCIPICDPLLQDCNEGQGCYWANTEFQCIFSTQDIPEGEPCGYINDCLKGNVCVQAESLPACAGASCCAGWCDLNDPTCQIAGTDCEPWFAEGEAPPGLEDVGVCVVPGG